MRTKYAQKRVRKNPAQKKETVGIVEAGKRLGIGRSCAYQAAASGRFPVPIIKVGGRRLVSIAALDALLGGRAAQVPRDDT